MEKVGWHYSHTEGKPVYGYPFLGGHLGTGEESFCYDLERYDKENHTKMQISEDILRTLPETDIEVLVLTDNWYTGLTSIKIYGIIFIITILERNGSQ